ncbi:MAG: sulfide-dependent adenosine diphosphate thiazole synthase [Treponemataceae bacterium]|nr:sulfide-dependent adenosine diphosphate thiazole synthase [Treponemataceae bacterium]
MSTKKKDPLISKLIVEQYLEKLKKMLEVDVAIAGAGPSALTLAGVLAKKGWKVLVLEAKNEPGGGVWGGGMMFNELVLEEELQFFLDEQGIWYTKKENFLVVDSVHFASALVYQATKAGAIILNNVFVEDLVMYEQRINGVVINWLPVIKEKMQVDPLSIVASYVVDATGHPAHLVRLLLKRNIPVGSPEGGTQLLQGERGGDGTSVTFRPFIPQEMPMDAENGERLVVEHTGEVYPGLYVTGMAAVNVGGAPRMGPIFGGMILSGLKAAQLIEAALEKRRLP